MAVFYDVFNGDADGLCALHQLRLAEPRASVLVTGVKRDIALVERVEAGAGDELTVLDVSLARNAPALAKQLARGATCRYFDHHDPGEIPAHPNFKAYIDTSPDVCTSLIVNRYVDGRWRAWAVVAAFGDNLESAALAAASPLGVAPDRLALLRELGACLNYNAYGDSVEDLNYHPADLYHTLSRYTDPFEFVSGEPVFEVLKSARADDMYRAEEITPEMVTGRCAIYVLPDAAWSRRVSGSFSNRLATAHPQRASAVLTRKAEGYTVSLRTPRGAGTSAVDIARQFATGGGRHGAAGIDHLPEQDLGQFISTLRAAFA